MFCMLLRKQLLGGRVLSLKQIGGDRVLHLAVDTVNELGDHVQRLLILEVMGRHSNLTWWMSRGASSTRRASNRR